MFWFEIELVLVSLFGVMLLVVLVFVLEVLLVEDVVFNCEVV